MQKFRETPQPDSSHALGSESSPEHPRNPEQDEHRFFLTISRHLERLPSGVVSAEGIRHGQHVGEKLKGSEVLKGYASDHKSGRAVETSEIISEASQVTSPLTGKPYRTRTVPDIQYNIFSPDFDREFRKAKDMIDEATLTELGMSTERDARGALKVNIEKVDADTQERAAPVRQKNQHIGIEYLLQNHGATRRMAMGLGHQLIEQLATLRRYRDSREQAEKPITKKVILNSVTHGAFQESLLQEAGVIINDDGQGIPNPIDFNDTGLGGILAPGESMTLGISDLDDLSEKIPVQFDIGSAHEHLNGTVFIDRTKLEALEHDYQEWKTSQSEGA